MGTGTYSVRNSCLNMAATSYEHRYTTQVTAPFVSLSLFLYKGTFTSLISTVCKYVLQFILRIKFTYSLDGSFTSDT